MASPIVRGQNFGSTELVTATKLQDIVDKASFKNPDGSTEVFNVSGSDLGTCVAAGGLEVKDNTGQLQIKDSGVTKAKIENVANMKVLGNTSGSATAPQEVAVLDEDTMTSDSATSLATQQSIKAYVDSVTIGINQTWQAVTRVIDDTTEYTNNAAKPITVLVNASYLDVGGSDDLAVYMRIKPSGSGTFQTLPLINQIGFDGYSSDTGSAIIPPGSTYKFLQGTGFPTITNFQFYELR